MHLDILTKVGKITIRGLRDRPGVAADIFAELLKYGIDVLVISFDTAVKGRADLAFIVYESQVPIAQNKLYMMFYDFFDVDVKADEEVALLKFTGDDSMRMLSDAFNLVATAGANIEMIAYSSDKLLIVIREIMVDHVVETFRELFPNFTLTLNGEEI